MASFCHKRVSTPGKVTGCEVLGAAVGTGGAGAAGVQVVAQGLLPGSRGGVCPSTAAQWLSRPRLTNQSALSTQIHGWHGSY